MSCATQYQNCYRPEPIRNGFVLCHKITVFDAPSQRRIRSVCSDKGHLSEIIVRLIRSIAKLNDRIKTQIPIDRCLS
ncbi:hypothetical protein GALL_443520 [mine drainage metagenome]|uniref:Uncharacterized protein n=1 Tax=mine drainage metagenome TaxID=410659 RepID=A0A1J5PT57_9ZZZZ